MTVHSDLDLVAALAQGTPGRLLGTAESDRLDFKQSPYPLQTDKGKYDLCSDVAALANAGRFDDAIAHPEERVRAEQVADSRRMAPGGVASDHLETDLVEIWHSIERWFSPGSLVHVW